jgi:hypothetical protein
MYAINKEYIDYIPSLFLLFSIHDQFSFSFQKGTNEKAEKKGT